MIRKLVEFCLRERLVVLIITVALIGYGWHSYRSVPVDAIPNVSENQVIVLTEWPGRSPKDIEDQITYPLSVALQSVAGAESVRGKSMFGFSFVQVTFADSTDFYWARTRVLERLATVSNVLPESVNPVLAPDATPLGQIFYYVLDPPPEMDLAKVRSGQDFVVKYALQSVEGVAEVASIGGYVKQYQIEVDPDELRYHQLPLSTVINAVKASNIDVGAKTVEKSGMEFIVRGRGFIGSGKTEAETIEQIEDTVVTTRDGVPITVGELAQVQIGPAFRRGALDFNGHEAVGGVVVMRYGENPRKVIDRVKAKIASLESELGGIRIVGVYDRTQLISETIATLTKALSEETVVTIIVMVLFLLHVRASTELRPKQPVVTHRVVADCLHAANGACGGGRAGGKRALGRHGGLCARAKRAGPRTSELVPSALPPFALPATHPPSSQPTIPAHCKTPETQRGHGVAHRRAARHSAARRAVRFPRCAA